MEHRTTEVLNRAAGVLLGCAVGDALGAGYEFNGPCDPDTVTMLPGSLTGRPAGEWTDDTEMAIAIALVAAEGGDLRSPQALEAIGARFLEWFHDGPDDIGNQTASVLAGASGPDDLARSARAFTAAHPRASAANGSLMRTAVVALATLDDADAAAEAARAVSALTHPDPRCTEACVLWTLAVRHAVLTETLDLRSGLAMVDDDLVDLFSDAIDAAEHGSAQDFATNQYVVSSLEASWFSVVTTMSPDPSTHFERGIRRAVALGNDTDTTAAITGALLGAAAGASGIRADWTVHLGGWPRGLDGAGLVDLAHRIVQP
jgi:ADP-ribosyl-[dinitrogen reductase] hydrolase